MATKAKAEAASPPVEYACGMDKIRDELAKDPRQYVQVVGEFLTGYLLKHPEAEEKIMAEGKSIGGSLRAMEDAARKVKQGSVAVLDDRTAFGIVLGYFGIEGEDGEVASGVVPATRTSSVSGEAAATFPIGEGSGEAGDPFDLDALMGVV